MNWIREYLEEIRAVVVEDLLDPVMVARFTVVGAIFFGLVAVVVLLAGCAPPTEPSPCTREGAQGSLRFDGYEILDLFEVPVAGEDYAFRVHVRGENGREWVKTVAVRATAQPDGCSYAQRTLEVR